MFARSKDYIAINADQSIFYTIVLLCGVKAFLIVVQTVNKKIKAGDIHLKLAELAAYKMNKILRNK